MLIKNQTSQVIKQPLPVTSYTRQHYNQLMLERDAMWMDLLSVSFSLGHKHIQQYFDVILLCVQTMIMFFKSWYTMSSSPSGCHMILSSSTQTIPTISTYNKSFPISFVMTISFPNQSSFKLLPCCIYYTFSFCIPNTISTILHYNTVNIMHAILSDCSQNQYAYGLNIRTHTEFMFDAKWP